MKRNSDTGDEAAWEDEAPSRKAAAQARAEEAAEEAYKASIRKEEHIISSRPKGRPPRQAGIGTVLRGHLGQPHKNPSGLY